VPLAPGALVASLTLLGHAVACAPAAPAGGMATADARGAAIWVYGAQRWTPEERDAQLARFATFATASISASRTARGSSWTSPIGHGTAGCSPRFSATARCKMVGNPRYGPVGLLSLPAFVVFELLGPIVELLGYIVVPISYMVGLLNTRHMLAFLAAAFLLSMLLSVFGVFLEDITFRRHARARDLALLILVSIVENLGYRQLTVWWRVISFYEYWRGVGGWGQMERRGLSSA
jgi:hypothetical protein